MIRRPPRSTQSRSSAASDVYKRQTVKRAAFDLIARRQGLLPHLARAAAPRTRILHSAHAGTQLHLLLPDITAAFPALKVLVVTMHVDRALADLALQKGAHGFIPKEASAEELNGAIEAVLSGKLFISPRVPRRSFRDTAALQHPYDVVRLVVAAGDRVRSPALGRAGAELDFVRLATKRLLEVAIVRTIRRADLGEVSDIGSVRCAGESKGGEVITGIWRAGTGSFDISAGRTTFLASDSTGPTTSPRATYTLSTRPLVRKYSSASSTGDTRPVKVMLSTTSPRATT